MEKRSNISLNIKTFAKLKPLHHQDIFANSELSQLFDVLPIGSDGFGLQSNYSTEEFSCNCINNNNQQQDLSNNEIKQFIESDTNSISFIYQGRSGAGKSYNSNNLAQSIVHFVYNQYQKSISIHIQSFECTLISETDNRNNTIKFKQKKLQLLQNQMVKCGDIHAILQDILTRRSKDQTVQNKFSSRSHLVIKFTVFLNDNNLKKTISIIDLAGIETIQKKCSYAHTQISQYIVSSNIGITYFFERLLKKDMSIFQEANSNLKFKIIDQIKNVMGITKSTGANVKIIIIYCIKSKINKSQLTNLKKYLNLSGSNMQLKNIKQVKKSLKQQYQDYKIESQRRIRFLETELKKKQNQISSLQPLKQFQQVCFQAMQQKNQFLETTIKQLKESLKIVKKSRDNYKNLYYEIKQTNKNQTINNLRSFQNLMNIIEKKQKLLEQKNKKSKYSQIQIQSNQSSNQPNQPFNILHNNGLPQISQSLNESDSQSDHQINSNISQNTFVPQQEPELQHEQESVIPKMQVEENNQQTAQKHEEIFEEIRKNHKFVQYLKTKINIANLNKTDMMLIEIIKFSDATLKGITKKLIQSELPYDLIKFMYEALGGSKKMQKAQKKLTKTYKDFKKIESEEETKTVKSKSLAHGSKIKIALSSARSRSNLKGPKK